MEIEQEIRELKQIMEQTRKNMEELGKRMEFEMKQFLERENQEHGWNLPIKKEGIMAY